MREAVCYIETKMLKKMPQNSPTRMHKGNVLCQQRTKSHERRESDANQQDCRDA